MKKTIYTFLCFLVVIIGFPVTSVAQKHVLNGVVIDQATKAHLAFVKIVVNNKRVGAVSDINGMFALSSNDPIRQLLFTVLGYQPLIMDVRNQASPLIIELIPDLHAIDSLASVKLSMNHYIDSVIQNEKFDQMKRKQESLLSGEAEMGWFSADLHRLFRYNQFEGLYLGAGGHTNDRLSRSVSMGGFAGYGLKDRKTKYGFDVSVWPDQLQNFTIKAGYSYDTRESGGSRFFDEKSGVIDPAAFRFFYVRKMDFEQKAILSVSFKQNFAEFYGAIQRQIIDRGYDISNGGNDLLPDRYNVSGIVAGIKLAPGQKFLQSPGENDSKRSALPVMWFQLTRGIPGLLKSDYNFNRYEGKIQMTHQIRHLGWSTLQVIGCLLEGRAPYFEYFNGRGSYGNFGLFASGSFVTMHPDEFMNDRSLAVFFSHDFGKILYHSEISSPGPAFVFNYGWGKLQTNPAYYFLPTTDMHKGFVEAGLQLNNLLDLRVYGLGIGAYYRMGAYSNSMMKENLVFKIVISFPGQP